MRYFMDISYDGSKLHGWQKQGNASSIQEVIEERLSTLLGKKTSVTGSGRTDAGVHAIHQIAHFDTGSKVYFDILQKKLNSFLDQTISINNIYPVPEHFHARFSAVKRTYHYHIHQNKNPFKYHLSLLHIPPIDVEKIRAACAIIKNHTNFKCFSKVHTNANHFDCDIYNIYWTINHQTKEHLFILQANRFLRGMVRAVVGTLLDVGSQKTSIKKLKIILESKDRKLAGKSVAAHGLHLKSVEYPTFATLA